MPSLSISFSKMENFVLNFIFWRYSATVSTNYRLKLHVLLLLPARATVASTSLALLEYVRRVS